MEVRFQPLSDLLPQCFCCHLFKRKRDGWLISSSIFSDYEQLLQILHFGPKFGTPAKLQNSSADPFDFLVVFATKGSMEAQILSVTVLRGGPQGWVYESCCGAFVDE